MRNLSDETIRFYFRHAGTGRMRVFRFCKDNDPTQKELAEFLKKEYGIGGSHPACLLDEKREEYIADDHDAKGLRLKQYRWSYDPETKLWPTTEIATTLLTWSEAAIYVLDLIEAEDYIHVKDVAYWEYWRLRKTILGAA